MNNIARLITVSEGASLLGISPMELLDEAAAGRLTPLFTVEDLLGWRAATDERSVSAPVTLNGVPSVAPAGGAGNFTLSLGPWTPIPPFTHTWPDATTECYDEAFQSIAQVNGHSQILIVAFGGRTSAGMIDRARAIVFYKTPPRERPLVEFSGNRPRHKATRYACPIKPRGGNTQLRPRDPIPEEYAPMRLEVFSDVIQGPRAMKSIAVVAETQDQTALLDIMGRHGAIRGYYKDLM